MRLRWYQDEATTATMDALEADGECHPIVVAPTGSGKTVMICDFIDKYLTKKPTGRILILSHVKEILEQDFEALTLWFPDEQIGLYSSGLKSRDRSSKITVAGIQSIYKKAFAFINVDIVIIDECHLVTIKQSGMYRKFLKVLKANYVGFTATHFRLGHGYIHKGEGALFNKISYDLSQPDVFNKLVEEKYLTRLITKATVLKMDTRLLKLRGGDFIPKELSTRFDRQAITEKAVNEIIEFGENYKKWLVFAIDIDHAEHITDTFKKKGIEAQVVHSKMRGNRDEVVWDFRTGRFRCIVNVDILTTGLDVPDIDLIAMLRPTHSPVIHVQTIGRGLRTAEGKSHCLVLDFAGNTQRLGPINDVIVKTPDSSGGGSGQIVKECPDCQALHPPKVKICDVCGHEFKFKTNLRESAGIEDVVRKVTKSPEALTTQEGGITRWHNIDSVNYSLHHKVGKPTSLKVTYRAGLQSFSEYVAYDHSGWAGDKARHWARYRAPEGMPMPKSVFELFEWSEWLKRPTEIRTNFNDQFPQVKDCRFQTEWERLQEQNRSDTPKVAKG